MTEDTVTPELPDRMTKLPKDKHGRPVPAFVEWFEGVPDFRVMRSDFLIDAHRFSLCWVCGQRRGRTVTFVIGPMCAVNRVSAEPPSHYECARYSALACPFLTRPDMVRRDRHMPQEHIPAPGVMLTRNPGVTLLWTTRDYSPFWVPESRGFLFRVGVPDKVEWWSEGREATQREVLAAIESGLPSLQEVARKEGRRAEAELERDLSAAMKLVPA
jgi:hypothetical protein